MPCAWRPPIPLVRSPLKFDIARGSAPYCPPTPAPTRASMAGYSTHLCQPSSSDETKTSTTTHAAKLASATKRREPASPAAGRTVHCGLTLARARHLPGEAGDVARRRGRGREPGDKRVPPRRQPREARERQHGVRRVDEGEEARPFLVPVAGEQLAL